MEEERGECLTHNACSMPSCQPTNQPAVAWGGRKGRGKGWDGVIHLSGISAVPGNGPISNNKLFLNLGRRLPKIG